MYKVKTDIDKNRIIITLGGILTNNEAIACKEVIEKEAEKLAPGFDVINDFSNLHLGQDSSAPLLMEIINYLTGHKVNRIVRVVGSSENALIQFARLTSHPEAMKLKYVPTLKDAEVFLGEKHAL